MDIDHTKREIYMPLPAAVDPATGMPAPPEALLLVDYDNGNVGEQQPVAPLRAAPEHCSSSSSAQFLCCY